VGRIRRREGKGKERKEQEKRRGTDDDVALEQCGESVDLAELRIGHSTRDKDEDATTLVLDIGRLQENDELSNKDESKQIVRRGSTDTEAEETEPPVEEAAGVAPGLAPQLDAGCARLLRFVAPLAEPWLSSSLFKKGYRADCNLLEDIRNE